MAPLWVTPTGFQKKTLDELVTEYEALFVTLFGEGIDLDPEGPFGQLAGTLAKRDADLWDGANEIYTSRNPSEATGASLDNISAETGVTRIDASPTEVLNVQIEGTAATLVSAGSKIKAIANDAELFTLQDDVTISIANTAKAILDPDTPSGSGGEVYSVTIASVLYTYTALVTETKGEVLDKLILVIEAGSWEGSATNDSDTYLVLENTALVFTLTFSVTFTLDTIASPGRFLCDTDGAVPAPTNTLTVISTPVSGWDTVTNPNAGLLGRLVETDAQLRIRRATSLLTGNATDEAIRAALLNNVDGVTAVSVTSNRTLIVDGDGRPAKSFESVVIGGTDADIGNTIWLTMPSGIQPYGSESEVIVDSEGRNQTIGFSRATNQYIHVKVKRDFYTEETYPATGDDQIKAAIVLWAQTEFDLGTDVIRQRISTPVYTVPGIGDIEITIDATNNPGDTPSYASADLPMTASQLAVFDITRIVVEVLTP